MDCQARKSSAINTHLNMPITALNVLKIEDCIAKESFSQSVISIESLQYMMRLVIMGLLPHKTVRSIVLFQALLFASFRVAGGFSNGKIGYIMVLIYGLFLVYMKFKTKGLLTSTVTNVIADSPIFYLYGYILFNTHI